jgi:hypothetical protein
MESGEIGCFSIYQHSNPKAIGKHFLNKVFTISPALPH